MSIPQYQVLVLKLSPIYMVSLNTVFSIPQNQCYPGTPCTWIQLEKFVEITQIEPMGLQMVKMTQIKMRLNLNFAVQTTFIKACCRKLASTFYGNCYFCTMMIRISFSFKAGPVYQMCWLEKSIYGSTTQHQKQVFKTSQFYKL